MPLDPAATKVKLAAFKRKRKFSDAEWRKRGLMPSSAAVSGPLESMFNDLATRLAAATSVTDPSSIADGMLRQALLKVDRDNYDTEEAEFVCALFAALARIFELRIGGILNSWLYGEALGEAASESAEQVAQTLAIQTLSQPCTKCGIALETLILSARPAVDFESWLSIECASCNELNFLVLPPGIGSLRPNGYKIASQYWRDQFNRQTAEAAFKKTHEKRAKKDAASKRRKAA